MSAKKSTKKPVAKKANGAKKVSTKKPNALHEKLIKLFTRPNGATVHDTMEAGFKFPAMAALRIAERRGLKVSHKKVAGELTRYFAKRA
jgi:hypothetical protein